MEQIKQGSLIVFEGLDRTGKSTQIQMLNERFNGTHSSLHMPSGSNATSAALYHLMETEVPFSAAGRQLLHLACHMEEQDHIADLRSQRGVLLDRWWWSTVAYASGTDIMDVLGIDNWQFFCRELWHRHDADMVFLFDKTYADDDKNRDEVLDAYNFFYRTEDNVVKVPKGDKETVHDWIVGILELNGLLQSA